MKAPATALTRLTLICLLALCACLPAMAEEALFLPLTEPVEVSCNASADGWSAAELSLPEEAVQTLHPGAVLEIRYQSEDGSLWLVLPDAAGGAETVGFTLPVRNGAVAYFTCEQLSAAAFRPGDRLRCSAATPWQVTGVRVGQYPALAAFLAEVDAADPPEDILSALINLEATRLLTALGYLTPPADAQGLAIALRDFQVVHGLTETGLCDAATFQRLNADGCTPQRTVYKSKKGKVYHEFDSCSGMKTAQPLRLSEALRLGLRPCEHCHR